MRAAPAGLAPRPRPTEDSAPLATSEQLAVAAPAQERERAKGARDGRLTLVALGFITPALLFYTVFLIVPLLGTIALSFTEWNGLDFGQIDWVGIRNYRDIANDHVFWMSL